MAEKETDDLEKNDAQLLADASGADDEEGLSKKEQKRIEKEQKKAEVQAAKEKKRLEKEQKKLDKIKKKEEARIARERKKLGIDDSEDVEDDKAESDEKEAKEAVTVEAASEKTDSVETADVKADSVETADVKADSVETADVKAEDVADADADEKAATVFAKGAEADSDSEEDSEEEKPKKKKKKKKKQKEEKNPEDINIVKELLSLIIYIGIVIILCYGILTYVGQRTTVHGSSMYSTLESNDNLWIDKLSYKFKEPERFDIVVFPYQGSDTYFIKRIIGLPGETIWIDVDGTIYIDDQVLDEDYGYETISQVMRGIASEPITLGPDEYFVMGDNRNDSRDSRWADVGNIKKEDFVGKAIFRLTPFDKMGPLTK